MAGFGVLGALLGVTVGGATYAAAAVLRAPTGCQISVVAAAVQGALRLGPLNGGMGVVTPVLDYMDHIRPGKQKENVRWWTLCVMPPVFYEVFRLSDRHPILLGVSTLLIRPLLGPGVELLQRLANKGPLDVWLSLASQIKARRNYGGISVDKGKDRHGFKF
ncbi:hypothetical protein B0H11DRAFT_2213763 [Mycena galericulata]|nr:hypothetical protein B0H11DRAFT_2213763 [Mycena galericulata]